MGSSETIQWAADPLAQISVPRHLLSAEDLVAALSQHVPRPGASSLATRPRAGNSAGRARSTSPTPTSVPSRRRGPGCRDAVQPVSSPILWEMLLPPGYTSLELDEAHHVACARRGGRGRATSDDRGLVGEPGTVVVGSVEDRAPSASRAHARTRHRLRHSGGAVAVWRDERTNSPSATWRCSPPRPCRTSGSDRRCTSPWRGEAGRVSGPGGGGSAASIRGAGFDAAAVTPPRTAFGGPTLPLQGRVLQNQLFSIGAMILSICSIVARRRGARR